MFLGEFVHVLDNKGRLTIPAKFRAELDSTLVVTRGLDRCLAVYPIDEWNHLAQRASDLPMTNRQARALRRLLFANASDVSPDGQGRILIPPNLRTYADLDGEVVVVGIDRYIELWNPEDWEGERDHLEGDGLDIDALAALGI